MSHIPQAVSISLGAISFGLSFCCARAKTANYPKALALGAIIAVIPSTIYAALTPGVIHPPGAHERSYDRLKKNMPLMGILAFGFFLNMLFGYNAMSKWNLGPFLRALLMSAFPIAISVLLICVIRIVEKKNEYVSEVEK